MGTDNHLWISNRVGLSASGKHVDDTNATARGGLRFLSDNFTYVSPYLETDDKISKTIKAYLRLHMDDEADSH